MLNRAERRNRAKKSYRRRKKIWLKFLGSDSERINQWTWLKTTSKPCSCPACGNPRKHFNSVTRQESLADLKLKEALRDLDVA